MRALVINKEVEAGAKRVIDFARGNVYHPHQSENIPGHDPRFVLQVPNGYRCVFSFTQAPDGSLWRHLTVSVDGKGYPHPAAAFMLASVFGFTGYDVARPGKPPPQDWIFSANEGEHCVVVAQPCAFPPA